MACNSGPNIEVRISLATRHIYVDADLRTEGDIDLLIELLEMHRRYMLLARDPAEEA